MRFLQGVFASVMTICMMALCMVLLLYVVDVNSGVVTKARDAWQKLERLPL